MTTTRLMCRNCGKSIVWSERGKSWLHDRTKPFAAAWCRLPNQLTRVKPWQWSDTRDLPYREKTARPAEPLHSIGVSQ